MNKQLVGIALVAFVVAIGLSILLFGRDAPVEDVRATYLPAGEFKLSHGESVFDMQSLRGAPYVLYFGFTHCPDVCPTGLATIRDALQDDAQLDQVKALFVTVDPQRDTAERVEQYAQFFHPAILGRTGTLAETQALAKAYGTYFMAAAPDENGQYSVDHTAYFYLINADGELKRVLDHDTDAATLSAELRKLI